MYAKVQAPETPQITEHEVIFLEAHDIHAPIHAWKVIEQAIAAKRHDDYARKVNNTTEPVQLTPELSMLAGICQKVTFDVHTREKFKQLYGSCFARGKFDKTLANPARINPYPTR